MIIAVPVRHGEIWQDFEKAGTFRVFDIDNRSGKCLRTQDFENPKEAETKIWPSMPRDLEIAEFLEANGVDSVICGGISKKMREALSKQSIQYYAGVSGDCKEAVSALLCGSLEFLDTQEAIDLYNSVLAR